MKIDLSAAMQQYERTEPAIQAWAEVNPQEPLADGPLNGVPFGAKDIFDTAGLTTAYGSELYAGRRPDRDAALVAALRRSGAVLFGKTRTAAFAYFDPPPTRNPRNMAHTPGGSSSGSAAAVAAGVVPFALATQTMGSIIRPASFCGVVGWKPTFGTLSVDGVLPFAPSLDTVGWIAEDARTCSLVWQALGFEVLSPRQLQLAIPEELPPVSSEMQSAFHQSIVTLGAAVQVKLPETWGRLLAAARTVNDFEGARSHHRRWLRHSDRIGSKLAELVQRGLKIPDTLYGEARQRLHSVAPAVDEIVASQGLLVTPAAPGAAPEGLGSTGDPIMNAIWTALGMPTVTIPMPVGRGMPLGLQVIAGRGMDAVLLGAALHIEALFAGPLRKGTLNSLRRL